MKSFAAGIHSSLLLLFALALLAGTLPVQAQTGAKAAPKGSIDRIKVHGDSLEGNLEGDSPERDVVVYLPPSYEKDRARRYPAVYFLHGYGVGVDAYIGMLKLPDAADNAIAAGAREMILVFPDAKTIYDGSMYSSSPTTGNWEGFITHDLVEYIDSHYRTLADRDSRGLSGHSMGGYGTVRIGMKYPEVYSALYAMSSCCLLNNPQAFSPPKAKTTGPGKAPATAKSKTGRAPAAKPGQGGRNPFANVVNAEAAAWSPNPANPPQYFDLPTKDGQVQPMVAEKWAANSPLAMVDQYVPSLKKYRAIAMDVGDKDTLKGSNVNLHEELTRMGVNHTFEEYDGDHMNHVAERFQDKLLPFFSKQLKFR